MLKNGSDDVVACHGSEGDAADQLKALYASEPGAASLRERRHRAFAVSELRVERGARGPSIIGHAAVFNAPSEDLGGFREMIAPGAFGKDLSAPGIFALWNHDERFIIAGTNDGSLRLSEDKLGLRAEMDPIDTPTIHDLVLEPIRRGLVNKMSFAFDPLDDSWGNDQGGAPLRTLKSVRLFDVSPVTFPAYAQTDISMRALAAVIRSVPRDRLRALLELNAEPMTEEACDMAGGEWDEVSHTCLMNMDSKAQSSVTKVGSDGERTLVVAGADIEIYRRRAGLRKCLEFDYIERTNR